MSVFPAHAGMFPILTRDYDASTSFPRARGDVPHPASAWRADVAFSPRTRGCSLDCERLFGVPVVFPAHAGMFPFSLEPTVMVYSRF